MTSSIQSVFNHLFLVYFNIILNHYMIFPHLEHAKSNSLILGIKSGWFVLCYLTVLVWGNSSRVFFKEVASIFDFLGICYALFGVYFWYQGSFSDILGGIAFYFCGYLYNCPTNTWNCCTFYYTLRYFLSHWYFLTNSFFCPGWFHLYLEFSLSDFSDSSPL